MDNAFRYIQENKGIDTEVTYPYEAQVITIIFGFDIDHFNALYIHR